MNYNELVSKYESYNFSNINYIDLFDLLHIQDNINFDYNSIKKYITTKYYSLALKYHPDKFNNNINSNIMIDTDEILSGAFLSFINEIYNYLLYLLKEDIDNFNISKLINNISNNNDCFLLKKNVINNHFKLYDEQINKFNNDIIKEEKLSTQNIIKLIDEENENRIAELSKIEKLFTDKEMSDYKDNFNDKFNNKFIDKNDNNNDDIIKEIQPYNYDESYIISKNMIKSISTLEEAYAPVKLFKYPVNKCKISYENIIEERYQQDKLFKNPKLNNKFI